MIPPESLPRPSCGGLQEAVASQGEAVMGPGKTMVFCGTVVSAEQAAATLREAGVAPLVYHRDVLPADREDIVKEAAVK
jgi:superfamily II DNA helicase RecQ